MNDVISIEKEGGKKKIILYHIYTNPILLACRGQCLAPL